MRSIFIGMLFVFLNININIGGTSVGLIPDFIGYCFMLRGLTEIEGFSERFTKIKPIVKGMAIYSAFIYLFALIQGPTNVNIQYAFSSLGFFVLFLSLVSVLASLYISYNIIMGIKDIEGIQARDLHSERLHSVWKVKAVFSILTFVIIIAPALAIISMLVSFVVAIIYLIAFNKSKKLFYS